MPASVIGARQRQADSLTDADACGIAGHPNTLFYENALIDDENAFE